MNYSSKTLSDLAGGDDRIFVVIDDRDDVWLKSDGRPLENLIKVPAYYYTAVEEAHAYKKATFFEKVGREVG